MFDDVFVTWVLVFIAIIGLWILPWKAIALWKSARRGEVWWFIALLLLNTMAILEILYIFIFSKRKKEDVGKKDDEVEKGRIKIKEKI